MHLCRSLFPTILNRKGKLLNILLSNIAPTHSIAKDLTKGEDIKDKFRELSTYCKGCHYTAKNNSELIYWCFPKENKIGREIAVIKNGNKIYRRSFCISGTNIVASPDYVKGNRCFAIIEGTPESIITDQENLSDIGHEIYDVMETQSFNNPVLLSFTIDNGLE